MTCPLPTVGQLVRDLCLMAGITNVDTTEIDDIVCRGFITAGPYTVANSIRTLQKAYFFDLPEIDGNLVAVLRGGEPVATIYRTDMVRSSEAKFETSREQGVEFPKKLHLAYASAESDYTPTKETSERRSDDIKSLSDITIEVPMNLEADDAAQKADIMHKTAWVEQGGTITFAVSEKFAYLTPSDIVLVEASNGVFKRVRIQKEAFVDGIKQIDAVIDRASTYTSSVVAPTPIDPTTPESNLPSNTIFEIMDLPALLQPHDTLHVYAAAAGTGDNWTGATIEQLFDGIWVERGNITYPSTMGVTAEALPTHAAGIDTTNSFLVTVSDDDIASISQDDFDRGLNLALVDDELINFRDVVAEGDDFRLSHLNRGALNTTPATNAIGSRFVSLVAPTLVLMTTDQIGDDVTFRVYSEGKFPVDTTGSVPWESFFQVPIQFNTDYTYRTYPESGIIIPVEGISVRFTVPETGEFAMTFNASNDLVGMAATSKTGAVNQGVLDFTTEPTHVWTLLTSTLVVGLNRPVVDLDLIPGETYFFNLKNNTPVPGDNRIACNCTVNVYP